MTMQLIKLDEEGICDYYKKRFSDFDKDMKNELTNILKYNFNATITDRISLKESKFEITFQEKTKELKDSIFLLNKLTDKDLFEYDSYNQYLYFNKNDKNINNSIEYLINGQFKYDGQSVSNSLLDVEIERINHLIDIDNKKGFIHELDNHLIYSTFDRDNNFLEVLNRGFEKAFSEFREDNNMKINMFFNGGFETYLCNVFSEKEAKNNDRINYYYNEAYPGVEKKLIDDMLHGFNTHEKIIKRRTI